MRLAVEPITPPRLSAINLPESLGGRPNSEVAGQIRSAEKGGPETAAPACSRPERSEW